MFEILRRFWVVLNSANSTKSLSVAVVLGLIVGLTPTISLYNLILVFAVLIFTIHFGLFLLIAAFFSFVGFIFDPLFKRVGEAVLTAESLNPLFTTLYNIPLLKLFAFNNTVVMGSLITALLLAPFFYLGAQFIFKRYRGFVMQRFATLPFVNKLFYNELKQQEKLPLFRKSGIIAAAFLALLIVCFSYLLLDLFIKFFLVHSIEKTTAKEVRIESVSSDIFKAQLQIKGFALHEEDKIIASFDKASVDLGLFALFDKKLLVQKLELKDLNLNESSFRALAQSPQEKQEQKLTKKLKNSIEDFFNKQVKIPTVQEVLAKEKLASVQKVKKIQLALQDLEKKYTTFQNDIDLKKIENLKQKIAEFQKQITDLNDPAAIMAARAKFQALQEEINRYQKRYTNIYTQIAKELATIQADIASLKELAAKDAARLQQKYGSPNGLFSIAGLFTQGQNALYLQKIYNSYLQLKPYLQSDAKTKEDSYYYRDKGEFILYEDTSAWPRVFIEEAKANLLYKENSIDILLTNYTTNQNKTKKPSLLIATGKSKNFHTFELKLLNDTYSKDAKTKLNLYIQELQSGSFANEKLVLQKALIDLEVQASLDLFNDVITSDARVYIEDAVLEYKGQRSVSNALQMIKDFDLKVDAYLSPQKTVVNLQSDAKKKFTKILSGQLLKAKEEFRTKLQKDIAKKLELDTINTQRQELSAVLKTIAKGEKGFETLSKELTKTFKKESKLDGVEPLKGIMKDLF